MKIYDLITKLLKNHFTLILFATLFSILYQGYYFGGADQVFYVPYLKALKDPSLYPNDIFISTWKEVYFGNLWKALAFGLNFFPLEPMLFVLQITFRFFFFLAVYLLSLQIFKKKNIAYFAVVLWFIPKPSLGFEIFYNEFVQAGVVLPILLFSILFFLKNKYLLSFILLGLSFHVHPPMSGFVLLAYVFYFLYKKEFKNLFVNLIVVGTIAIPIIIPTLGFASANGGYGKEWLELTKIRSSHHSFPFFWPKERFIPFLLFSALFLLSLKKIHRKIDSSQKTKIYVFLFTFTGTMLSGLIFSEVFIFPKLIVAVPFHISSIFSILASLFIIAFIYFLTIDKSFLKRFFGYLFFIMLFFNNFWFNYPRSEIIILGVFLCGSVIIFKLYKHGKLENRSTLYLAVFLFTIIFFWFPNMVKKNLQRSNARHDNWIKTQEWAYNNTTKKDIFIVPIYESGFRLYSERSIVADWKDGSAGYLSPKYIDLWWKKMTDFGLTKNSYSDSFQKKSYLNLSSQKVIYLGDKYNANFFITENKKIYPYRILYKNNNFVIYKLKN